MSRSDSQRLEDILAAIQAIRVYLRSGALEEPIVYDAVRMRLIEVGEAVKALDPELLTGEPGVPWRSVAAMRDRLAHSYFDTLVEVLKATVAHDLEVLEAAVVRITVRAEAR